MADSPIVRHISESYIRPKYELENAANPVYLTPTDLAMLSADYIQNGLLFSKSTLPPTTQQHDPINTLLDNLKKSLSLALVHFYPLAGQLETVTDEDQHTSLVFIDCNKGPGARFIHAHLNMSVSDILTPTDVPRIVHSFFDHDRAVNNDGHTRPLLSIQVTELTDGVFIGCSFNHSCGDGTAYWNFFNTWSEIFMAHGEMIQISRPPVLKRWFINGTGPAIKLPFTHPDEFITRPEAPEMRERILHFSSESIAKLKAKANAECETNNNIPSFQALSALVWRCITRARCFPDDTETRCRLVANSRGRLDPPLSNSYFGNAIGVVQGSSKAGELLRKNLGWAALLLHQAVADHTNEKLIIFLEKWMESPFVHQIRMFDGQRVVMGCSPRFDMYGCEFGMGKAVAVLSGYANKFDGMVNSYPGRDGGGSVDLEICLPPDAMCALESDEEFTQALSGNVNL